MIRYIGRTTGFGVRNRSYGSFYHVEATKFDGGNVGDVGQRFKSEWNMSSYRYQGMSSGGSVKSIWQLYDGLGIRGKVSSMVRDGMLSSFRSLADSRENERSYQDVGGSD